MQQLLRLPLREQWLQLVGEHLIRTSSVEFHIVPTSFEAFDDPTKFTLPALISGLKACSRADRELNASLTPIELALEQDLEGVVLVVICHQARLTLQTHIEAWTMDTPEARPHDALPLASTKSTPREEVAHTLTLDKHRLSGRWTVALRVRGLNVVL